MGKLLKYPFTIIFSCTLLFFFVAYFVKDNGNISEKENRYLAQFPKLSMSDVVDGSFMESFDSYVEDQVILRTNMIALKMKLNQLFGKCENNNIVSGKEGYLFEKIISPGENLVKNEQFIESFVLNSDRDIKICIAPNSMEILKDRLPKGMVTVSQAEYINDFYSRLGSDRCINLLDILSEHSSEYIYYHTDHHWTSLGAYYAYEEICRKYNMTPVSLDNHKEYKISDFYGTYYSKYESTLAMGDTITYYGFDIESYSDGENVYEELYDYNKSSEYDKYGIFLYGNPGLGIIKSKSADTNKSMLIFKDSYANCLIPYLTANYEEIVVVDLRYYNDSVKKLMDDYSDSDVCMLFNFSHLNEDNHFYRLNM